jgi:hypothetical protein
MSLSNFNNRYRNKNSSSKHLPNINNHTTLLKSKINIIKNEKLLKEKKTLQECCYNNIYSSPSLNKSGTEKKEIKKIFSPIQAPLQISIYDNKLPSTSNSITNNNIKSLPSLPSSPLLSNTNITKTTSVLCDKCDGKHQSNKCPHYKKDRYVYLCIYQSMHLSISI